MIAEPTVESFDLVRIDARWRTTLALVLSCGAVAGMAYNLGRPGSGDLLSALTWGLLGGMVWTLLGFTVSVALLRWSVRLLGGQGHARVLAYNLAISLTPLVALSVVLGRVPFLGAVLSGLLLCYGLVLAVVGVISAERLEIGRAVGAVLLTLGVLMLLALVAVVFVALWVVLSL